MEKRFLSLVKIAKLSTYVLVVLLFLLLSIVQSQAGLIGLSSSAPAALYDIDTATGAATFITTVAYPGDFVGLEFWNGRLYASDLAIDGINPVFGYIDIATGDVTVESDQDGSLNWWGLAADRSEPYMYTVEGVGNVLKSVFLFDPSPDTPGFPIGPTGVPDQGAGLAFDDVNKILYSVAVDGNLYTLDRSTGASTLIGPTGLTFPNVHLGLAFDSNTGILYLNDAEVTNSLYSIDTSSGSATLIGPNGTEMRIDGLAFLPNTAVPEPTIMLLIGTGLAGLAGFKRRFKK